MMVFHICSFILLLFAAPVTKNIPIETDETKNWVRGPDKCWSVHYESAREKAEKENKFLFVLNTGSDWCPYCVRLREEVLEKSKFKRLAAKKFIPVFLDSPREKKLPKEQSAHNQYVRRTLKFSGGVPCARIYDTDEKLLGEIRGFLPERAYLDKIEEILQSKPKDNAEKTKPSSNAKEEEDDPEDLDDDDPPPSKTTPGHAEPAAPKGKFAFYDLKIGLTPDDVTLPGSTPLVLAPGDKVYFRLEYTLPEDVTAKIRFMPVKKRGFTISPGAECTGSDIVTGFISREQQGECFRIRLSVMATFHEKKFKGPVKFFPVHLKWE